MRIEDVLTAVGTGVWRWDNATDTVTLDAVSAGHPRQIRDARHEIRALLHDWQVPEHIDAAMLLVSELCTNVLVHTDEDAVLTARLLGVPGGRRLRAEVQDRNDDMPHPRTPGEMASSGRGLLLIETLADVWSVEPRGDGKAIWFELYEVPGGPRNQ